ncbi:MAG: hypothetical protein H6965_10350 [Chromatiaceae bacterium]|nr:hypothetical protein [Chromatiaceae bacterium]
MKKSANLAPLFGATLLFATLTCNPLRAGAVSLTVDLDPATAGVQSTLTVAPGDSFNVAILIADALNVNGFALDLGFDPALLSATSVSDGGFLLAPTFVGLNVLGTSKVEFDEVTLLPLGASGSGVLAMLGFDAVAAGVTTLSLTGSALTAPFGSPVSIASLNNATLTISTPTGSVSEPESIALFSVGLLGLLAGRRSPSLKAASRSRSTQKALG